MAEPKYQRLIHALKDNDITFTKGREVLPIDLKRNKTLGAYIANDGTDAFDSWLSAENAGIYLRYGVKKGKIVTPQSTWSGRTPSKTYTVNDTEIPTEHLNLIHSDSPRGLINTLVRGVNELNNNGISSLRKKVERENLILDYLAHQIEEVSSEDYDPVLFKNVKGIAADAIQNAKSEISRIEKYAWNSRHPELAFLSGLKDKIEEREIELEELTKTASEVDPTQFSPKEWELVTEPLKVRQLA